MLPTDMKRLRELEDDNSRLKKIVADLALDKEMLQDVLSVVRIFRTDLCPEAGRRRRCLGVLNGPV